MNLTIYNICYFDAITIETYGKFKVGEQITKMNSQDQRLSGRESPGSREAAEQCLRALVWEKMISHVDVSA